MDPWTLKIIGIPVIAAINFVSGFVPFFFISHNMKVIKSDQNSTLIQVAVISRGMKRFLSLANFFSAGVFLSTCFIGLYPGVNSKFSKMFKKNPSLTNYPYAGISLALGFFLVWLLEMVVHGCIHHHASHASHEHDHVYDHVHDHNSDHNSDTHPPHITSNNANANSIMMTSLTFARSDIEETLLNNGEDNQAKHERESLEPHETHSHVPVSGSILGSVILTFALGSHSLIEGLGFGVLDDLSTVINMLVTIVIHESICAVSLGVNIATKKTPMKAAGVLIFIFAILIPLGIALGLILNFGMHKTVSGEIVTAVLQGVAAGTFIYVVFMEILPAEMASESDELLRLFVMVGGFAVIAGIKAAHTDGDSAHSTRNQTLFSRHQVPLTHGF